MVRLGDAPLLGFDTETTGVDVHHDARPYLVTTCTEQGEATFWQWRVNPLTRMPIIPDGDLEEIREHCKRYRLVIQGTKFDVGVMHTVDPTFDPNYNTVIDTLFASHLVESDAPKDLTSLARRWLGVNVDKYEDEIRKATLKARDYCRRHLPDWFIATKRGKGMPSASESTWKFDMWLPRELAFHLGYPPDHPWFNLCANYANSDSTVTVHIAIKLLAVIKERGLEKIYRERLKLLRPICMMEAQGVTANTERLDALFNEYTEESRTLGKRCVNIARHHGAELDLPKSGNNDSLKKTCFGWRTFTCSKCGKQYETTLSKGIEQCKSKVCQREGATLAKGYKPGLSLPLLRVSKKSGDPSLDTKAIDEHLSRLNPRSMQAGFLSALQSKRKRDTALTYMESYRRFALPYNLRQRRGWDGSAALPAWVKLYPSLNPTGTHTLRWSSQNPNEQNISKKEGFNLRFIFGPGPGRLWVSMDANNIELRLPAYESHEDEMIQIFERPDDPPYYGSYHMLVFDTLYPNLYAEHGPDVKKLFASTKYQWTKNGNFAVQYGAVEESGTADAAYHYPGAQRIIKERFKNIAALNQQMINHGQEFGYVETIPDRTVDPNRGYPLRVPKTKWGRVKPTVPLNYHIQGTAMWWMSKAMVRCQALMDQWAIDDGERLYFMIMQVHDELVFEIAEDKIEEYTKEISNRMESAVELSIPLVVDADVGDNWEQAH